MHALVSSIVMLGIFCCLTIVPLHFYRASARRYANAVYAVVVCPSVCLSFSHIVSLISLCSINLASFPLKKFSAQSRSGELITTLFRCLACGQGLVQPPCLMLWYSNVGDQLQGYLKPLLIF